jgi:hypothetical protein
MEPKMTSQFESKNSKTALVPSELKSKPREGCEREVETATMRANAASTKTEKKESISWNVRKQNTAKINSKEKNSDRQRERKKKVLHEARGYTRKRI